MKKFFAIVAALALVLALGACGRTAGSTSPTDLETPELPEEAVTIRVGAMTGPTAMGMVKLMSDGEAGLTENSYDFSLETGAAAFPGALAKGEIDIAAVPANLAATVYNNTDGGVQVLAINTLGVLYIVERGETISSVADLAGRTVYATGSGATPEYALRYILDGNGLSEEDVTIQWCADTTEVLSYLSADETAVAMLPQPFVTVAQSKVEGLGIALDLNAEWDALETGSSLITGVIVVRREFAETYPQQTAKFLEEYAASVQYTIDNNEAAAELIAGYEIVPAAAIAQKALPYCNITYIAGADMKAALSGYLEILFGQNPQAVGGAVPGDDFWYGAA